MVQLADASVPSLILNADLDEVRVLEDCAWPIARGLRVDGVGGEDAVDFGSMSRPATLYFVSANRAVILLFFLSVLTITHIESIGHWWCSRCRR